MLRIPLFYYYNINEGKVNGSEIINRMVNVVDGGADIQQDGLLNKYPFNLTAKESYEDFGSQIANTINNTIDNVNHFSNLESTLRLLDKVENK